MADAGGAVHDARDNGAERPPALDMQQVSKRYPGTIAVDGVDFQVEAGEIHALVGENGAGKSTLMKMLAGSFDDYTGRILIDGKEVLLHSPAIAKENGIGMIYQELALARPISIAENLLAGRLPTRGLFIDRAAMDLRARELLEYVGLDLDPSLPVEDISPHQAQLVEIAKVLGTQPRVLVMDEPTSALSREEVERLFEIIKNLKANGLAIVYISHHLPEIFEVADRVTVLRDAKRVGTENVATVKREQLVQMMVGRSVKEFYEHVEREPGATLLEVDKLTRYGFFHDISFTARSREIVGICGLAGAGRSELARVICGLDEADEGSVLYNGREVLGDSMARRMEDGIAYLAEDRKNEGLAMRILVNDNILSCIIGRLSSGPVYNKRAGDQIVKKQMDDLSVYPPDPFRTMMNLSGGNQQKVLLAKWLATEPRVLILDEPTRGVDIGAKTIIHDAIQQVADAGAAVVLISSDLPELVGLVDRVMIMRKGHFIREMPHQECTEESLLLAANGEGSEA